MDLQDIKITRIDISEWLIKAIRSAKEKPDGSGNLWKLNESKEIVEFELRHKDFDYNIDFDLYYDSNHVSKIDVDCKIGNHSHVSELYPDTDMIDFDDNKLEQIYSAVLSHF